MEPASSDTPEKAAKTDSKHKRKWLVAGILVLGIIVGGVVFFQTGFGRDLLTKVGLSSVQDDTDSNTSEDSPVANQLNAEAREAMTSDGSQAAIEVYQAEISKASDNETKAQKLMELSTILWNNGEARESDKQQALKFALEADQSHPSPQSAAQLVLIYRDMGKNAEADHYIKLRDERAGQDANDARGN